MTEAQWHTHAYAQSWHNPMPKPDHCQPRHGQFQDVHEMSQSKPVIVCRNHSRALSGRRFRRTQSIGRYTRLSLRIDGARSYGCLLPPWCGWEGHQPPCRSSVGPNTECVYALLRATALDQRSSPATTLSCRVAAHSVRQRNPWSCCVCIFLRLANLIAKKGIGTSFVFEGGDQ